MKLKISIITENGIYYDSENIPKEIKKNIPDDLEVSSVMAKGILSMDTKDFSKFLVSSFLPDSITDKNEEIKYYFEVLPEHQNFVAKIADRSYIMIFDNNYLAGLQQNIIAEKEKKNWPILDPRLIFWTNIGGIVRVNSIRDKNDNFEYTEVVFTLRDVELK